MSEEWEFSAMIEDDGDLSLEWYASKHNVITVCFDAVTGNIYWAAMVGGIAHHGSTSKSTEPKP